MSVCEQFVAVAPSRSQPAAQQRKPLKAAATDLRGQEIIIILCFRGELVNPITAAAAGEDMDGPWREEGCGGG